MINIIHRDGGGDSWHKGHIIPHSKHGPDIYENIKPICNRCNGEDRKYPTNYHYRVVIGTMLAEDLKPALAKIKQFKTVYEENATICHCDAVYTPRGAKREKRCENSRIPGTRYCGIHNFIDRRQLTKVEKIMYALLAKVNSALKLIDILDGVEIDAFHDSKKWIVEELLYELEKNGPVNGIKFR